MRDFMAPVLVFTVAACTSVPHAPVPRALGTWLVTEVPFAQDVPPATTVTVTGGLVFDVLFGLAILI